MRPPRLFVAAALAGLAALGLVAAEPGPAVLPNPSTPTDWACSTKTLESATDCVLDAETKKGSDAAAIGKENVKLAQALAGRMCKPAAKVSGEPAPDETLFASCQKEFTSAAEGFCTLDGESVLLDAQGRFALEARSCYAALDGVLRKTRMQAALGVRCCRCLEKSCNVPRTTCAQNIGDGELDPAGLTCVESKRECARACSLIAPSNPAPASAPAAPGRPSSRARFEWL